MHLFIWLIASCECNARALNDWSRGMKMIGSPYELPLGVVFLQPKSQTRVNQIVIVIISRTQERANEIVRS